jgi:hypothetical protein
MSRRWASGVTTAGEGHRTVLAGNPGCTQIDAGRSLVAEGTVADHTVVVHTADDRIAVAAAGSS